MKIRDKLFLGFGLYLALAVVFAVLAYKDLGMIGTHLRHLETSDDIANALLEVRRYEKNFLLYHDSSSLDEIAFFLKTMKSAIEKIRPEMVANIGSPRVSLMDQAIGEYEQQLAQLGRSMVANGSMSRPRGPNMDVERMRITAREVELHVEANARKERSDIEGILKMSATMLFVTLGAIVLAGTIINTQLARSIVTPINDLERVTRKISRGDFSESIEVKGQDEISELARSFNQMEDKLDQTMTALDEIIKKLREKQSQLVEAEKLASIGKLAAGIAHEINNPLTSVLTFSNLMLEQCPPEDPRHSKLKLMVKETDRARTIIRQLLNFGRESVIKPEKIDINRPVTEIAESLVAQEAFRGIELSLKLAEGLPEVYADPAQLGQVVLNLLLNAVHAITPPGRIEVSTALTDSTIEIRFSDTGKGIPQENLHRIFDPFFTTKSSSKGTGLGLAVSYGIIKKHGGDIMVESVVGKGTTFTVRLPLYG